MDRQEYIKLLTEQIRCKKALPLVTGELEVHIEEQKRDFMAEGMSEREAEEMAVREMGDPVEVGVWMDEIHRPKMNWPLIFLIGLVSAAGLGAWYYLNNWIAGGDGRAADYVFSQSKRYLFYTAAGFGCMVGICYIDYTWLAAKAKEIMLVYCGLLTAAVCFFTPTPGMSDIFDEIWMRGIWIMPFLFIPLYCGVLYSYRGKGVSGFLKGVAWMTPIAVPLLFIRNRLELLLFLLVLVSILSYTVFAGMFRIPVKGALAGIWSTAAALAVGIITSPSFVRGAVSPKVYGEYMIWCKSVVQSLMTGSHAIGSVGESVKNSYVSSEFSDIFHVGNEFVLTYMAMRFGTFVFAAAVLVIGALLLKMVFLAAKQKNPLGRLTGIGCILLLLAHMAGYVLANMGFVAPEQMYCPFNVGDWEVVVTYVLLGVVLSIYRYQNISEA